MFKVTDGSHGIKFRIHRLSILIFTLLLYMTVFFHRNCLNVITKQIVDQFHISTGQGSLMSSLFYWTYGLIQPFISPLADVFEPYFLLFICAFIAAGGAIVSGTAKSFAQLVIGRVITGIGVGSTYHPCTKFMLGWYHKKYYVILIGAFLAAGGIGSFLASYPLHAIVDAAGWRWAFYFSAIMGIFSSSVLLIIARGNPKCFGYDCVEGSEPTPVESYQCLELFSKVFRNIKQVLKTMNTWICIGSGLFGVGSALAYTGYTGALFLSEVLSYSQSRISTFITSYTVGQIVFSFGIPFVSKLVNNNKFLCIGMSTLMLVLLIVFYAKAQALSFSVLYVLITIYIGLSFGTQAILTTVCTTSSSTRVSSTANGILNSMVFIGAGFFTFVTKWLTDNKKDPVQRYRINNWLPNIIYVCMEFILLFFLKPEEQIIPEKNSEEELHESNQQQEEDDSEQIQDVHEEIVPIPESNS